MYAAWIDDFLDVCGSKISKSHGRGVRDGCGGDVTLRNDITCGGGGVR
jgi:hypothetical protein